MEQNTPIKPQYVTGDMFLNYTGVNLEESCAMMTAFFPTRCRY